MGAIVNALTIAATILDVSSAYLYETIALNHQSLTDLMAINKTDWPKVAQKIDAAIADSLSLNPEEIMPEDIEGLPLLGSVYVQHELTKKAKKVWELYLERGGRNKNVNDALEDLKQVTY